MVETKVKVLLTALNAGGSVLRNLWCDQMISQLFLFCFISSNSTESTRTKSRNNDGKNKRNWTMMMMSEWMNEYFTWLFFFFIHVIKLQTSIDSMPRWFKKKYMKCFTQCSLSRIDVKIAQYANTLCTNLQIVFAIEKLL